MLVVDDHPVVRDGVITQLARHSDIAVIGHAADAADALRQCVQGQPDVVLLDLRLPDGLAPEVVPRLRAVSPQSRILLFTAFPEHAAVGSAFAAGACGLLVKDASGTTLREALRQVFRTGGYHRPVTESACAVVTPREHDVLRLVAVGDTNVEIGDQLGLSLNTVKSYLRNVMRKLNARNRAQLISHARAQGLL
ncbi:response regulator [Streptomyces geranii]|uniref:response regulator n=1 Tax=Streptomyces geranii TaxID=2058923 RepID=UPI0018E53218|nr:response regulator transcription factor [Streptomyces geranii]